MSCSAPQNPTLPTPPQELYLESNELVSLPSDLALQTQLRKLYLDGNPGLVVPPAVEQLPCMLQVGVWSVLQI